MKYFFDLKLERAVIMTWVTIRVASITPIVIPVLFKSTGISVLVGSAPQLK